MNENKSIRINVLKYSQDKDFSDKKNTESYIAEEKDSAPIDSTDSGVWGKISKICLKGIILLSPLFFLPFTILPVDINKQVLVLALIFIALISYLLGSINLKEISYPKSLLGLSMLAFLVVSVIGAVLSKTLWISIWGNLSQPDSLVSILTYILAFFLIAVVFKKEDLAESGIYFLIGLVGSLVTGLIQMFGLFLLPWNFTKQPGFNTIGSILAWGGFMAFGLAVIISSLINLKLSKTYKIVLSAISLAIVFGLIVINYQMIWMALALIMLLLSIYEFSKKETWLKINLSLIALVVSVFFIFANSNLPPIANLPLEARPNLSSSLSVAKDTLWGKRIFFGSGPSTFQYDFASYKPDSLIQTDFWQTRFDQGYDFLLTFLANFGLFGILAAAFLIFSFFKQIKYSFKDEYSLVVLSGVAFLTLLLLFFPASFVQLLFIFLGLGILSGGLVRKCQIKPFFNIPAATENNELMPLDKENGKISIRKIIHNLMGAKNFGLFLGIVAIICFSLMMFYWSGLKYAAAIYYEKGMSKSSLEDINQSVNLDSYSDASLRALSQAIFAQGDKLIDKNISQDEIHSQTQNLILTSINLANRATEINPYDSYNWDNLGSVYESLYPAVSGADNMAIKSYQKAIEVEPKNPQLYVDLARILFASADQFKTSDKNTWQQRIEGAKQALETSIELKPDYVNSHLLLGQIFANQGDSAKAIEQFEILNVLVPNNASIKNTLDVLKSGASSAESGAASNKNKK